MSETPQWYAHGKLLVTGEYLVMEGALAFALPLKFGQSLRVESLPEENSLFWEASHPGGHWFNARFRTDDFHILATDNAEIAGKLREILLASRSLASGFLSGTDGFRVTTQLEFDPAFGFGSSSTLISNLAYWAGIDPYRLLELTFGGSGFDIACARSKGPLFFWWEDDHPRVEETTFNPPFKNRIYFVYLGHKQKSTESIRHFRRVADFSSSDLFRISDIGRELARTTSLQDFEELLTEHEQRLSTVLKRPTIQSELFPDFGGVVKSLGGWGGDFVLITGTDDTDAFRLAMKERGFDRVFTFDELILQG